jgi:hypothetical protein
MTDIKDFVSGVITRTQNPVAPILLQDLHGAATGMAKTLAAISSQEQVEHLSLRLLRDFSDTELKTIPGSPEFLMALCALVTEASVAFAQGSTKA